MMRTSFIECDDDAAWNQALTGIPHAIAHTRSFVSLLSRDSGGRAGLFVAESEYGKAVCPIAERSFQGAVDVYSPYGFGGFSGTGNLDDLAVAWRHFAEERRYVAAYLMLNPSVLPAGVLRQWHGCVETNRTIYLADLRASSELRLQSVSQRKRGQLRKWLQAASIETDQQLLRESFVRLYPGHAKRTGAGPAYWFSNETLREMVELPGTVLVGVHGKDGDISCVALMGMTPSCGDYLFMASSDIGKADGAGVLWLALEALAAHSVSVCNLGGGIAEGDGVAELKRRLGGQPVPLPIIRQVFDRERYHHLCRQAAIEPASSGFFPAYYAR